MLIISEKTTNTAPYFSNVLKIQNLKVNENSIFVIPPYFDDENDYVTMIVDLSDTTFATQDGNCLLFHPTKKGYHKITFYLTDNNSLSSLTSTFVLKINVREEIEQNQENY